MKARDETKIGQIFAATLQLVVEMGIAGITMRQIAKKARLATGTLYIYFRDKDDLIHQLYEDCRNASINAYFKGYDPDLPFKEGFRIIWINILHFRIENFDAAVFMEQSYHSPFISESSKEMSRDLLRPLFKLMERGKEAKVVKELDTVLLLMFMVGSTNDVIKYIKYHQRKLTDDIIQQAFTLCWDGLKR